MSWPRAFFFNFDRLWNDGRYTFVSCFVTIYRIGNIYVQQSFHRIKLLLINHFNYHLVIIMIQTYLVWKGKMDWLLGYWILYHEQIQDLSYILWAEVDIPPRPSPLQYVSLIWHLCCRQSLVLLFRKSPCLQLKRRPQLKLEDCIGAGGVDTIWAWGTLALLLVWHFLASGLQW